MDLPQQKQHHLLETPCCPHHGAGGRKPFSSNYRGHLSQGCGSASSLTTETPPALRDTVAVDTVAGAPQTGRSPSTQEPHCWVEPPLPPGAITYPRGSSQGEGCFPGALSSASPAGCSSRPSHSPSLTACWGALLCPSQSLTGTGRAPPWDPSSGTTRPQQFWPCWVCRLQHPPCSAHHLSLGHELLTS